MPTHPGHLPTTSHLILCLGAAPNGSQVSKSFSLCVQVHHSRMKGKQVTLAHAQQLFAQERETVLVSLIHTLVPLDRLFAVLALYLLLY